MRAITNALTGVIHNPPLQREAVCEQHGAFAAKCYLGNVWTSCPACREEADAKAAKEAERAAKDSRRLEWQDMIGRSGIPERFRDRTLPRFEASTPGQQAALEFATAYADEFPEAMKSGRCAIFAGKPGTGKTHLAAGIGLRVMHKHGHSVLFTTALRAIRRVKDTWTRGSAENESQAVASLVLPDLLVLDEVGLQYGSDAEKLILFDFLNERYERRKPCILLSNLNVDGVRQYLGDRIFDRLREDGGTAIPFDWDSYRGQA